MKKFLLFTFLVVISFFAGREALKLEKTFTYKFDEGSDFLAAVGFEEGIEKDDLIRKYRRGQLKVLIVPGHDNEFSGTAYKGNDEADFNIELARNLMEVFANNQKIKTYSARDLVTGFYIKNIFDGFNNNRDEILNFKEAKKSLMVEMLANSLVEDRTNNNHAFATEEISFRLYAINKWANDNDIDLIIHVHFNDYPGHKWNQPGKYNGMTVYVPDDQYPNGLTSIAVGQSIFNYLNTVRSTSTNPLEITGVVPGQELIATGANASVDAASILIEYGYIYEPEFQTVVEREKIFKEMAKKTYEGLMDFLD